MWHKGLEYLLPVVCAAALSVGPAAGSSPGLELRFDRLNGVYEDLEAVVEPVRLQIEPLGKFVNLVTVYILAIH